MGICFKRINCDFRDECRFVRSQPGTSTRAPWARYVIQPAPRPIHQLLRPEYRLVLFSVTPSSCRCLYPSPAISSPIRFCRREHHGGSLFPQVISVISRAMSYALFQTCAFGAMFIPPVSAKGEHEDPCLLFVVPFFVVSCHRLSTILASCAIHIPTKSPSGNK